MSAVFGIECAIDYKRLQWSSTIAEACQGGSVFSFNGRANRRNHA